MAIRDMHDAILWESLEKTGVDRRDEETLIRVVDEAKDLHAVWCATILLRTCGTERCIPCLKRAMYYPKTDVKITSLHTISMIAGDSEADLYLAALGDTKFPDKFTAVQCIVQHCGERGIEPICGRAKKILRGERTRVAYNRDHSELTTALCYLDGWREGNPAIQDLFGSVLDQWDRLEMREQTKLTAELSFFRENAPRKEEEDDRIRL